jgi:recombination protein RecA
MVELVRIIDTGVTKIALALDSIGALESRKMIDDGKKGDVKADQGTLQKKIKRLMKLMVGIVKMQDSFGFMSGHYYGNPSGYGDSEKIGGGFYPKLASDIIILLKKYNIYENPAGQSIAEKGKIIGTAIKAATNKNRNYPPFQEATVNIDYKKGIDPLAGIFEIASEMGIINAAGSWYSCDLLDLKVQGKVKFYEELLNMDYKPILDKIEEELKTTGYSTFVEDIVEVETKEELLVEEEEFTEIKENSTTQNPKNNTTQKPKKTKNMSKK